MILTQCLKNIFFSRIIIAGEPATAAQQDPGVESHRTTRSCARGRSANARQNTTWDSDEGEFEPPGPARDWDRVSCLIQVRVAI